MNKAVRKFSVIQVNGITCTDAPDLNHIAIRTSTPMHDRRLQNDLIDNATCDPQPEDVIKAVRKFSVMNHNAIRICTPTHDRQLQNDL
jgi:hypothetical protein